LRAKKKFKKRVLAKTTNYGNASRFTARPTSLFWTCSARSRVSRGNINTPSGRICGATASELARLFRTLRVKLEQAVRFVIYKKRHGMPDLR
jgi:hypothetical protein